MEICHVFKYKDYTKKQRLAQWFLYMLRHVIDTLSGIIGILTFGIIEIELSIYITEKILINQMKFYKENKK